MYTTQNVASGGGIPRAVSACSSSYLTVAAHAALHLPERPCKAPVRPPRAVSSTVPDSASSATL